MFKSEIDEGYHFALCKSSGKSWEDIVVNVRVISGKPLGDILSFLTDDEESKIYKSRELLCAEDDVVVLYLNNKSAQDIAADGAALAQQKSVIKTNSAMNFKQYGTGAQILRQLGVRKMRVHTSSPLSLIHI